MNINFLNTSPLVFIPTVNKKVSSYAPKMPLSQDVFQKSTSEISKTVSNKQQIQNIYDKVWDEVLRQNPIVKELNIEKPKIAYGDETEAEASASYNFINNQINTSENFDLSDEWCIYYRELEDGLKAPISVMSKKTGDEVYGSSEGVKSINLTNKEKELFVQSTFAHELRHCIQVHLCASTENAQNVIKSKYKDLQNTQKQLLQSYQKMKDLSNSNEYDKKIEELQDKIENNYALNYKPKKLFNEDMKLKHSIFPDDNRYLSVKDHIAKSHQNRDGINEDDDTDRYYGDPMEVDAYRYQFEYIITHNDKENNSNLRPDIVDLMSFLPLMQSQEDTMEKCGFQPLISYEK